MTSFWTFKTANFTVDMAWDYDDDLDLSWDDSGEVTASLASGEYMGMTMRARVTGPNGEELATDYLGGCIYKSPEDFRDHIGMNVDGHGSYFSDMIRTVCHDARAVIRASQSIYIREV